MRKNLALVAAAALASLAVPARAEDNCPCPQEPPPGWRGSIGAGLSFTGGNTETQNVSLSFSAVHDPKTKNIFKADGLWIQMKTDGETSADRINIGARDEYTISKRAFVFGEARYLRDRFKELSYLITPLVGVGYRLVETDKAVFSVDGSVGGAFEKLYGHDGTSDGAFRLGESLSLKLSQNSKLTHGAWGLWKMSDTADAFYHLDVALSTSISSRLELQLSFIDDYKNKPASPGLKKNDTAFVVNLVFKL